MNIRNNYLHTLRVSYIAYTVQAIAVNFAPLLFVTFGRTYGLSLANISSLILFTFIVQLIVDITSAKFIPVIGYRVCAVAAHITAAIGFILLGFLPDVCRSPYVGIMIACFFYSLGSGLIEVMVSPIVEACPSSNKESAMAFLHSFYSWGTALVIIVSTLFFKIFGIDNWRIMSYIWAVIPICNAVLYMFVPIAAIDGEDGSGSVKKLFDHKIVYVVILFMLVSGAAEIAVSQWASAFAEEGLKVSKTVGDLAGPCMFALMMGIGRVVYSAVAKKVNVLLYMAASAFLCIISYLVTALSNNPVIALMGCGIVGMSVGVFWPGTLSFAAKRCPGGGTAMFGMLAFSGDLGCTIGPTAVGYISGIFSDNIKTGLLFGTVFPIILLIALLAVYFREKKH